MCKPKGNGRQTGNNGNVFNQRDRGYAFVIEDDSNTERVTFNVGGVDLPMLIDSGASCNIVDEDTWEMLKEKKIKCFSSKAVNKPLYTYSSKVSLPVKGVFKCQIGIGKRNTETEFTVIQGRGEPLLSRKTAIELSVLRVTPNISTVTDVKSEIQRQYPKLFQGVGKLNTKQISLHIDESTRGTTLETCAVPPKVSSGEKNRSAARNRHYRKSGGTHTMGEPCRSCPKSSRGRHQDVPRYEERKCSHHQREISNSHSG